MNKFKFWRAATAFSRTVALAALCGALVAPVALATHVPKNGNNNGKVKDVVLVKSKGNPNTDLKAVQRALAKVPPDGTLQLQGVFDFGDCQVCLEVRHGMTIEGVGENGEPAMATIIGGFLPMWVELEEGVGSGNITIQRIHFTDYNVGAMWFIQAYEESVLQDLMITNGNPIQVRNRGFGRAGIAAQQINLFWADPRLRELWPRLAAFLDSVRGEEQLFGNFTMRNITLNQLAKPMEFDDGRQRGEDAGLFWGFDNWDNVLIENINCANYGECLEGETSFNPFGETVIRDNTVYIESIANFESETWGMGNGTAISVATMDSRRIDILDNDLVVTGDAYGTGIMGGTVNPNSEWVISGNNIHLGNGPELAGSGAAIQGSFGGIGPAFRGASMSRVHVFNNTITGKAFTGFNLNSGYGRVPFPTTCSENVLGPNNFDEFTPEVDGDYLVILGVLTGIYGPNEVIGIPPEQIRDLKVNVSPPIAFPPISLPGGPTPSPL